MTSGQAGMRFGSLLLLVEHDWDRLQQLEMLPPLLL